MGEGEFKFTWGDSATVSQDAPSEFRPGEYCAICGMGKVDNISLAKNLGLPMGTRFYTIEYNDGSSTQVAEYYLVAD